MSHHPEASVRRLDELVDAAIHVPFAAQARQIEEATYTGRDPEHLVTAIVAGDGVVTRIRFGATVASRPATAVEAAVLAAVGAARREAERDWSALADQTDAMRARLTGAVEEFERVDLEAVRREAEEVRARAGA